MSFDGVVCSCITEELQQFVNSKIEKIYQTEKDEIVLNIRHGGNNKRLLISASSSFPRIYISDEKYNNPVQAPLFCMILRKHIQGGSIISIEQYDLDRVIILSVSSRNEIGDSDSKKLIMEIAGRNSNIVLTDSCGKIIDSIKRVPVSSSRVRQILPGLNYEPVPNFDKLSLFELNEENFLGKMETTDKYICAFKAIYMNIIGLSPTISREICYKSGVYSDLPLNSVTPGDLKSIYGELIKLKNKILKKEYLPSYVEDEYGNCTDFYAFPLKYTGLNYKSDTKCISKILDRYYREKGKKDKLLQKSQNLRHIVKSELDKNIQKLDKLEIEIREAKDREKYKLFADLLSSYQYLVKPGDKSISVENYFDTKCGKLDIPLDPSISAGLNIQRYYKKYTKLKNADKILTLQIQDTKNLIEYLNSIRHSVEICGSSEDLSEIRSELEKFGIIKGNKKGNNKDSTNNFIIVNSENGSSILIGKNNRQNDIITHKIAGKEDYWFHVKNYAGSHVIIKNDSNKEPSVDDIKMAAELSAYFSSVEYGGKVDVDYTQKKYVSRHPSRLPGLVNYTNFKTIFVDLNRDEIKKKYNL